MADATEVQFFGLSSLVGEVVSVWLAGLDCGDYTVASDGSVTVPMRSDPDGILTAAYLLAVYTGATIIRYTYGDTPSGAILTFALPGPSPGAITTGLNIAANSIVKTITETTATLNHAVTADVPNNTPITFGPVGPPWVYATIYVGGALVPMMVPCFIGYNYHSRGQPLRPATEAEVKSREGSALGKYRRVYQVGALLDNTIGISFGTRFDQMTPAVLRDGANVPLDHATLFSGVYRDTIRDDSTFDGAVCWEISRPYPATVLSLTAYMNLEEP